MAHGGDGDVGGVEYSSHSSSVVGAGVGGGGGGGVVEAEAEYALYLRVDERSSVPHNQIAFWEHCNRYQCEEGWKGLHVTLCSFAARSTSGGGAHVVKKHGDSLRAVKGRLLEIRAGEDARYRLSEEHVSSMTWRRSMNDLLMISLSGPCETLEQICRTTKDANLYRSTTHADLHLSLAKANDVDFIASWSMAGIDESMLPQPGQVCPLPEVLKSVMRSIGWNVEIVRCKGHGSGRRKRIDKVTDSSPF